MTLGSDSQQLESYLPVYDAVPEKWESARPFITEQLKKISNAVNLREIGWFLDQELLTGKSFIPGTTSPGNNPGIFRSILRMVVNFGALPAAGTKSVPHGISFTSQFTLIQMWASATDPIGLTAFSMPYCDPTNLANGVSLTMDSTNINITVGSNRSNYTRCFVVVEYIQEI